MAVATMVASRAAIKSESYRGSEQVDQGGRWQCDFTKRAVMMARILKELRLFPSTASTGAGETALFPLVSEFAPWLVEIAEVMKSSSRVEVMTVSLLIQHKTNGNSRRSKSLDSLISLEVYPTLRPSWSH